MAKKNKADLTIFRFIARKQKFGTPDETAIYHFVKENFSNGQTEDIFVDYQGYEVDEHGNKKNGKDNEPYEIWDREGFEKFLDLSGFGLDTESATPKLKFNDVLLTSLKLEGGGISESGKAGFFASIDFSDYNNPQKLDIFIDRKDGKIYDQTGQHPKKIDLVNQKIVDAK